MTGAGSQDSLEVKIDKLAADLEKMRVVLASIPKLPENLQIENLTVGDINFKLENLNIKEVSGALNIGVTHGVNNTHENINPKKINSASFSSKEEIIPGTKSKATKNKKNKPNEKAPHCKINYS